MRLIPWLKSALICWAAPAAATLAITLLNLLDEGSFASGKYFFSVTVFLLMILQLNLVYQTALPLAVSFGATRREALTGLRLYRVATAVLCAVTAAALAAFEGENAMMPPLTILPFSLGAYLLSNALGGILGKLYLKWGPMVTFLIFFGIVICGAFVAALAVIILRDMVSSFPWQYLVLALGVAAHFAILPFDKKLVFGYTVKV